MKSLMCLLILALNTAQVYSQCGCLGGAPVGGLTPLSGTKNLGVLPEENLLISSFYRFNYGDRSFSGDSRIDRGDYKDFNSNYLGFSTGYGLFKDFSIEMELGLFINKSQNVYFSSDPSNDSSYKLQGSGLSHLGLNGKYNLYYDDENDFEITIGAGVKAPLAAFREGQQQHVQASTGAFGFSGRIFMHKGFSDSEYHLFFIGSSEVNLENSDGYRYGDLYSFSLFAAKNLSKLFTGVVELRNEYRLKDEYKLNGESHIHNSSGSKTMVISPQINFLQKNLNVSLGFDYPLYQYYNGEQLGRHLAVGFNLAWNINFAEHLTDEEKEDLYYEELFFKENYGDPDNDEDDTKEDSK